MSITTRPYEKSQPRFKLNTFPCFCIGYFNLEQVSYAVAAAVLNSDDRVNSQSKPEPHPGLKKSPFT